MKTSVVLALGAAGLVFAVFACKAQIAANPQPMYPDDGGAYNAMTGPDAGGPVMAEQPEAGPEAAGPNVVAAAFDAAAQELLKAQIKQLAAKHAPYMKTEGPLIGGMLAEGQSTEQQGMLLPGKCYTVVGTSPAGVTELDIQITLLMPIPTINPILAVDNMTGPQAFVGDHPNCYKNPTPIPAPVKITVKAAKGSGLAGAQLYVK